MPPPSYSLRFPFVAGVVTACVSFGLAVGSILVHLVLLCGAWWRLAAVCGAVPFFLAFVVLLLQAGDMAIRRFDELARRRGLR